MMYPLTILYFLNSVTNNLDSSLKWHLTLIINSAITMQSVLVNVGTFYEVIKLMLKCYFHIQIPVTGYLNLLSSKMWIACFGELKASC